MSNTLFVGKVYHRFEELPSTNDWAAELLVTASTPPTKTRPPEGTVVRADNQTAGRGQLGSRWQSEPGQNLLVSIIFYPIWLEAQAQFYLSMAVALALRDLALSLQKQTAHPLPVAIKWPNDLYINHKKIAGILLQNSLSGAQLQSSIAGIGLNVNQVQFPPDLPQAGSMATAFGQNFDMDEVATSLFENLERRYLQLKAGKRAQLKSEYETHLWRRGERARFVRTADAASIFEGLILGVTGQGLLRVETAGGEVHFEVKQIAFVS